MSTDLELRLKLTADNRGVAGTVRDTRREIAGLQNSLESHAAAARVNARNMAGMTTAGQEANRMFQLQKNSLQQVGYQVQDFVVQVGSGTSAFVALGQQGSQLLGIFGPGGALAGALLAIGSIVGGTLVAAMGAGEAATDALAEAMRRLDSAVEQNDGIPTLSKQIRDLARESEMAARARIASAISAAEQARRAAAAGLGETFGDLPISDLFGLRDLEDYTRSLTVFEAYLKTNYIHDDLQKLGEMFGLAGKEAQLAGTRIGRLLAQVRTKPTIENFRALEEELARLATSGDKVSQAGRRLIGDLGEYFDAARTAEERTQYLQKVLEDLGAAIDDDTGIQEMVEALQAQAAAIGETNRQTSLRIAREKGATDGQIRAINVAYDAIEAEERRKEALMESAEEARKLERVQHDLRSVLDRVDPDGAVARRLEADKKVIQTALDRGLIDEARAQQLVTQAEVVAKQAAAKFENAFAGAARSVSQSLQGAIAAGEWDSLGEGIGNAIATTASAIISDRITKSLSEGLTKNSSLADQAVAAFAGPLVGALVGGAVQLALRELGDYFSDDWDPTAKRQASQGTGTVLGDISAKSESIRRAVEGSESGIGQLVGINQSMLQALRALQAGVSGASDRVARGVSGINIDAPDVMSARDVFKFGAGGSIPFLGPIGLLGSVGSMAFEFFDTMGEILTFGLLDLDKLLGGKAKKRDEGIQIVGGYISDLIDETIVNAYATFRVKKHFLDDYDTKEKYQRLDGEVERQFALVFASIYDSVAAGAEALGMAPGQVQAAMDQFVVKTQRLSLENLSVDEQRRELEAYFGTVFDGLAGKVIPFLDEFQQAGEGLGETLARIANYTSVAQEAVRRLGVQFSDLVGRDLVEAAERLMEAAGGVDEFISSMQGFIDNFATDAQKFELAQSDLVRALEQANLTLPATRQGYYELLRAQDAATDAGARNIATLLKLQGLADQYYTLLEDSAEEALQAQKGRVSDLRRAYDALDSAMGRLFSGPDMAVARRQGALAYLQQMAADGAVEYSREFREALDAATNISMGNYATFADYMRDSAETGALILRLRDITADQISVEEQMLNAIEDGNQAVIAQLERVNQQLESRPAILAAPVASVQVTGASSGRSDAGLATEIQMLRTELAASQRAIAQHTAKTARLLERIEIDGLEVRA